MLYKTSSTYVSGGCLSCQTAGLVRNPISSGARVIGTCRKASRRSRVSIDNVLLSRVGLKIVLICALRQGGTKGGTRMGVSGVRMVPNDNRRSVSITLASS